MRPYKLLSLLSIICMFFCVSCVDFGEPLVNVPTVDTNAASNVTRTEAVISGSVISNGTQILKETGFRYSLYESMAESSSVACAVTGRTMSASISNLQPGTTYYYYAYVSGGFNEVRGKVLSFVTEHYGTPKLGSINYDEVYVGVTSVTSQLIDEGGADLKNAGFLYREYSEGAQIPSPDVNSGEWQMVTYRDYASIRNGSTFSTDLSLATDTEYVIVAFATNADGQTGYSQSLRLNNRGYAEVYKRVYDEIYKNGPFPFYPMDGCGNQPTIINGALHYVPTGEFTWFFIDNPIYPSRPGDYAVILRIKSSKEGTIKLLMQNGWDQANDQRIEREVRLDTEWKDVLIKLDGITCKPTRRYELILIPDTYDSTIDLASLTLIRYNDGSVEPEHVFFVMNSDMEGDDARNFARKENATGIIEHVITPGVGKNNSRGVSVTNKAGATEDWSTQFWIIMNDGMWIQEGQSVIVEFDYKATVPAVGYTQSHANPGEYQHWECLGDINFTNEWRHFSKEITISKEMAGDCGLGSIAFSLSVERDKEITYYFDNISVWTDEPLIP